MAEVQQHRVENLDTPERQAEQIARLVNRDSALVVYETVNPGRHIPDKKHAPSQEEIGLLLRGERAGRDISYDNVQSNSNESRRQFWQEWVEIHKDEYDNKYYDFVAENEWVHSNLSWIKQSTDTGTVDSRIVEHRWAALKAVGITYQDITSLPDIGPDLRRFRTEYGNEADGVQRFVQKIADSCRNQRTREFNLEQFNQRIEAMEDFFANFGVKPEEITPYLQAYVILETPPTSPHKKPMIDRVVQLLGTGYESHPSGEPQPMEDHQIPLTSYEPIPLPQPQPNESAKGEHNGEPKRELVPTTAEEKRKVEAAQKEIFEEAGKLTLAEKGALISRVSLQIDAERQAGQGRINKPTIPEMSGETETVQDEMITYIPKEQGKLVVVGDIHADSLSLEQTIRQSGFIENMESGNPDMSIVFLGDYFDRGLNLNRTLDILFKLKEKYGNKVILIRADHDKASGISDQDSSYAILANYFKEHSELQRIIAENGINLEDLARTSLEDVKIPLDSTMQKTGKNIQDFIEFAVKIIKKEDGFDQSNVIDEKLREFSQNDPIVYMNLNNYLTGIYNDLGRHMPIFSSYMETFDKLPRYVACGNGLTLSHGGPPPDKLANLQTLKSDNHILDDIMVMADPITPKDKQYFERITKSEDTIRAEIDNLIAQAQADPDHRIKYYDGNFSLNRLQLAKKNLDLFKDTGFHFNPRRMNSRAQATDLLNILKAAEYGSVSYTEDGLQRSLDANGGKVLVRGHQISSSVNGGQPFANAIAYSIHSTGGKQAEAESHYWYTEPDPKFAIFNKDATSDLINPTENIKSVWPQEQDAPTNP